MAVCQALKLDGVRCTQSGDMPYFWFKDSHNMFNGQINVCQNHYQTIFGKLMEEEDKAKRMISRLRIKVKNTRQTKKICRRCNCPLDGDLRFAKKCPRCGEDVFNNKTAIIVDDREERTKVYELISSWSGILNHIRNRKCRLCNHSLYDPNCSQCAERSPSRKYSHADSHSFDGKRRTVLLFHTICGRIWMQYAFNFKMLQTTSSQMTLEQTI